MDGEQKSSKEPNHFLLLEPFTVQAQSKQSQAIRATIDSKYSQSSIIEEEEEKSVETKALSFTAKFVR